MAINTGLLQAIVTDYRGPTDRTGARIAVLAQAGWMRVPYDHALNDEANHEAAALAYARRKGWMEHGETLAGGRLPNGRCCWVIVLP